MKIGILGAPGVGKTEFARQLQDLFYKQSGYDRFFVLDNYVDELRGITGQEYGEYGNFVNDLEVVFKRREYEQHWRAANTITVGTVLDSVIHNFTRSEEIAHTRHEVTLTARRLEAIASTFGLVYTETWDYDYALLLRSNDDFGKALVELIATYHAPVLSFNPEVTDDEKASTAFAAIRALEEAWIPPSDERGVRSGGEAGEAVGDSPEPVPDVPEQGRDSDDA